MGFAALRVLGMRSGISQMQWFRRKDGSAVISDVIARPPGAQILSLMSHAHGADLYRAWANAVVHDLFAPIPRQAAAGAVFFRGAGAGSRVVAVRGGDELRREIEPRVVEATFPEIGAGAWESKGWVVLRHENTAELGRMLEAIGSRVRIELG
jgi:hypothetical protein